MSLNACSCGTMRYAFAGMMTLTLGIPCCRVSTAEPIKPTGDFRQLSAEFCVDCHTGADAQSRLDLAELAEVPLAENFAVWRRVIHVLDQRIMPPEDAEQPSAKRRLQIVKSLRNSLQETILGAAHDPGPTVVRRLTNAEYDYCMEDLTGLRLNRGEQLVGDSVGGSGFTNSATAQFMQDATLERYMEAAKIVANHAMIGAGPIYFYADPGQTGMELSAINRIQQLYRQHGFRSSAGEGAKPYGLDLFARAFHVAWRHRYQRELGGSNTSLEQLAGAYDLEPKFAGHVWNVLHVTDAQFPLSEIIATWDQFTRPDEIVGDVDRQIVKEASDLYDQMQVWQERFAGSASAEEEAALLTGSHIDVPSSVPFVARALRKRLSYDDNFTPDTNDPDLYAKDGRIRFKLTIEPASPGIDPDPVVIFLNPEIRFRFTDVVQPPPVPLQSVLAQSDTGHLRFGENAGGEEITASDFVVRIGESKIIEVELPEDSRVGELIVAAKLDRRLGRDAVVRCTIEDITSERGRTYSSLLRDRESASMDRWEAGLEEFARALPQISHREPAPSDRDPIPAPYENTYNLPERNYFHTAIKYHRDDEFLAQHVIPAELIEKLDIAWTDLLTSFDYHDVNLRFVAEKYGIDIRDQSIATIDRAWVDGLPEEARLFVSKYKSEYDVMQTALQKAEAQHLQDVVAFASQAWRRTLTVEESESLKEFYDSSRAEHGLSHRGAIRATLVRVLVSTDFLYRIERAADGLEISPLTDFELASRLSFSLWSSVPDEKLLSAARDGNLSDEQVLTVQVRRMLRSPKSRRLATEFFGQWLGFYQFDHFRGVDAARFPEFDDRLKSSLYDQAISFFEYIVREDRPYNEILHADYAFLDEPAAKHYGIPWTSDEGEKIPKRISTLSNHRGGLFGLGAILTSTSAPLRTSPVKRGDWILRRLIGTPVPPPPPDVGSIPAEESLEDGKTVRQRLEAHRSRAECMNCHARIDPLGFALENFDSLGRWRETYLDGQPVNSVGILSSGETINGPAGLRAYMRQMDVSFRRTLATKLVGYFLGRAETVTDAALIDEIASKLREDPRFSVAVMTIVQSPQFRSIRGRLNVQVSALKGLAP